MRKINNKQRIPPLSLRGGGFVILAVFFILTGCTRTNSSLTPVSLSVTTPIVTTHKLEPVATKPAMPTTILLAAPFQPQAPLGDWSQPWQDACEEASIIVTEFALKHQSLSKEKMVEEIKRLVDYENKTLGFFESTNVYQTADIANAVYGLKLKILDNPTVEDIKKNLSAGRLIIAPMAGRSLHNPYFNGAGPIYHMLVIRGYDDAARVFITNEVGTKRGEAYRYPYQTLMRAIHDWPGSEDKIQEGPQRVLVTEEKI